MKGIVIDKDGTLFDYGYVWGEIISRQVKKGVETFNLKKEDFDALTAKLEMIFGVDRYGNKYSDGILFRHDLFPLNFMKILFSCFRYRINPFKMYSVIMEMVRHVSDNIVEDIKDKEFPEIRNIFLALKAHGYKTAIVTNDYLETTMAFLEKMEIADLVDTVECADTGSKKKPNPEAIRKFARKYSIEEKDIVCIGDTISDMKFSHNAGCGYTVAVLTGSGDEKNLKKHADAVYSRIEDIMNDKVIFS